MGIRGHEFPRGPQHEAGQIEPARRIDRIQKSPQGQPLGITELTHGRWRALAFLLTFQANPALGQLRLQCFQDTRPRARNPDGEIRLAARHGGKVLRKS